MPQLYEGPVTLTEGRLVPGWECKGTFKLFNMQTGELHREGEWEGTYCGSGVANNGNLYHHFLEASVDGQFCGFFGQPAYRFQGVTEAPQPEEETDYEILRDAITEHLNPVEDDVAEVAILVEAVERAGRALR